jgi:glutamate synthase domain-containing protein 2
MFTENARRGNVKMIEIKLSQGAKPGHGGILPAKKNTPEIAAIRNVKPYTAVISPPAHSTFSNPIELLNFVKQLRELSDGKPIGIKLCVGNPREIFSICKGMKETGIYLDFINVDGGEGGTGAAPLEYSNSVGMPLRDGLVLVVDCLNGFDLKKEVTVSASGKIISAFQIIKNLALGADCTNSARAMMLALGCIQALDCNKNNCPTGIATQDPQLMVGLVVKDKEQRVANFQNETVRNVVELLSAVGLNGTDGLSQLNRSMINRRVSQSEVKRYIDIFPDVPVGSFLNNNIPEKYIEFYDAAEATSF